jgi:membrane protein implicated in regulation of membrane protease activity
MVAIAFDPVSRPPRERFLYAIRTTIPHIAVLIVYLAFAVGYLDVGGVSVRGLFDQSQKPSFGDYTPVINRGVLTDARLAISWGFNIPRGWWGQWQHLSAALFAYLHFFQILTLALIAVTLIRPERKIILFGLAWFWIAVIPALPIATHFVPNYLFVSVVGLSIVVGVVFCMAYDALRSIQPLFAAASIAVVFAGLLYVNSRSIRDDIRDNRILGGSAKLAADTLTDLKRLYPTFPGKTTLYFADADESLQWEHDNGGLLRMAYGDDNIKAVYQSQGVSLPLAGDVAVVDIRKGHLFPRAGQPSP